MRINTLKANTNAVLQRFLNEDRARGSTLNIEGKAKAIRFEEGSSTTKGKEKMAEGEGEGKATGEDTQNSQGALQHPCRDEHIPDLLVLPTSTDLHAHPLLEVRFPLFQYQESSADWYIIDRTNRLARQGQLFPSLYSIPSSSFACD